MILSARFSPRRRPCTRRRAGWRAGAAAIGGALLIAIGATTGAQAQGTTVLTFEPFSAFTEGSPIPQTYGDNVTAATMGTFQYGGGMGFTPNVTVQYTGGMEFHGFGYGDLTNNLRGPLNTPTNLMIVTLTPDPGFTVTLNSIDLTTFTGSTVNLDALQVYTAGNVLLFDQANAPVTGGTTAAPSHTHYDFSGVTSSTFLALQIDATSLPDKTGQIILDNVSFSQNAIAADAPEPGALALLLTGGSAGFIFRYRSRRKQAG